MCCCYSLESVSYHIGHNSADNAQLSRTSMNMWLLYGLPQEAMEVWKAEGVVSAQCACVVASFCSLNAQLLTSRRRGHPVCPETETSFEWQELASDLNHRGGLLLLRTD